MEEHTKARITSQSDSASISTELASRRTGMSFQRTRMSADRTLMSVIRTSLSLIGFGFTLFQVFQKLHESNILKSAGLKADGLIHAESQFPVSLTLTVAILLLGIGVLAIVSMVFGVGPFG